MEQIRLGKSGLQVSAVGFGGIPVQRLSSKDAVHVIRTSLDMGVTFIDTAAGYGDSQKKIGEAIRNRRDEVVLASKSGAAKKDDALRDIEQARLDMNVSCIDLYQLHNVSSLEKWETIRGNDGALTGLKEARDRGMINHIGFTSHNLEMALELIEEPVFETVQFPFNMVTREPGDTLVPEALERDLGFIVMKPLCGGEYNDAELAFRFLNQFPGLVPIPGIETADEITQIAEIVESRRVLDGETLRRAEEVAKQLGKRFCRRCGYCMPCPQGIPVTPAMTFDSMRKRLPEDRLKQGLARRLHNALPNCTECGQCEAACPYELPIIEKLRTVREEVEKLLS